MTALTRPASGETDEASEQVGIQDAAENGSYLRLASEVQRRLQDCAYPPLHRLSASLSDGCVRLRGTVSSFFLKQVAQEIAMRAVASVVVQNEIEVDGHAEPHALTAPVTLEARLKRGDRVRVIHGALAGVEGVVAERHQCRIVVAVNVIQQGVSVEIDDYLLERI